MRAVWKYELTEAVNDLIVPAGATFLYATEQHDPIEDYFHTVVYALVDPSVSGRERRRLLSVLTAEEIQDNVRPLGVAHHINSLHYHVFEVIDG